MNDPIVGIDLGTSNTVVAHADDAGQVQVLADESGLQDPSVGGVVPPERRRRRRRAGEAAQGHRPEEHDLLGQAADRPQLQLARGPDREAAHAVPDQGGREPAAADRRRAPASSRCPRSRRSCSITCATSRARARRRGRAARSSPCRRASTTRSARRPRPPARSPASPSCACSTSRPPRRSPTATRATCSETIAVYDFGGGTFDITILKLARPGLRGARHRRRHVPRRRRSRRAPRRPHGREVPAREPHRPAHATRSR